MVHSGPLWNNVLEVGTAEKKLKARGEMVHYDAIWKDVFEVGTADNFVKKYTINYDSFSSKNVFTFQFMSSESSLL